MRHLLDRFDETGRRAHAELTTTLYRALHSETGAGLAEYALLVALVAVGLIATVVVFRDQLANKISSEGASIAGAQ